MSSTDSAREKIMNVAAELFAEKGLEGVSVREISKEADVNLSLVSYYFGGKEGLYKAVLEENTREAAASLAQVLHREPGQAMTKEMFRKIIHGVIEHMVEIKLKKPTIARLMMRERLTGLPHARHVYEEVFGPIADMLVEMFDEAKGKKIVCGDLNPRAYIVALTESIWGYLFFHDCKLKNWKDAYRFPKDKQEYIQFMVRLYTEGIYQ